MSPNLWRPHCSPKPVQVNFLRPDIHCADAGDCHVLKTATMHSLVVTKARGDLIRRFVPRKQNSTNPLTLSSRHPFKSWSQTHSDMRTRTRTHTRKHAHTHHRISIVVGDRVDTWPSSQWWHLVAHKVESQTMWNKTDEFNPYFMPVCCWGNSLEPSEQIQNITIYFSPLPVPKTKTFNWKPVRYPSTNYIRNDNIKEIKTLVGLVDDKV